MAGAKAGWLVVLLGREACERPRIDKPPSQTPFLPWLCGMSEMLAGWGSESQMEPVLEFVLQAKHAMDPSGDGHSTPGCWSQKWNPSAKTFLKSRSYQKIPWNFAQTGLVSTGMSVFYYNYHKLEIHKITEIQGHQWNSM